MIVDTFVHEVKNLIWYFLSVIKEHLLLIILPVERQVLNIDAVPMVIQLHASSVDNPLYFIGYYEFKILSSVFITYKQPIFDLDHTNEVLIVQILLLMQELLSHLLRLHLLLHVQVALFHSLFLIYAIYLLVYSLFILCCCHCLLVRRLLLKNIHNK